MNAEPVILGKRRFTCLAPGLVRLEFSPTGEFEDRLSLVAHTPRRPIPFERVEEKGDAVQFQTPLLSIITRQNESDFFPSNMHVEWMREGLTQTWQFGDRDYRNLGGAPRSLDYYNRDGQMEGVYPASNASPDDYLHDEAEFWEVSRVYARDGKLDWLVALGHMGVHGALKHAPQLVYNRNLNMALDHLSYPPGLLSRSGYFLLNDSNGPVLDEDGFPIERNHPGSRDLYFFVYNDDYKAALRSFRLLSGAVPLLPKYALGLFFCRWPAFSDPEARQLIEHCRQEGFPLSVLVLDLEWHVPDFWHWDWNQHTYPDPTGFLEWAHQQGVQVTGNIHPKYIFSSDTHFQPFVDASGVQYKIQPVPFELAAAGLITSGAQSCVELDLGVKAEAQALTEVCLKPLLEQGLDFPWLDMNAANLNGADGQLLCSKVFYEATEGVGRRGMLLGRYGGLGSHRYGVFFTGDTASQWEVLASECEFTLRAGQVGMAYVSHDIGGFSHSPAPLLDPDLYIRWLQFGALSPVLRFHSAPGAGSRQPWDYGNANLEIARKYLQLRHSLMPYLYSAARQAHESGLPLARGLYLDHPREEACYRFDEYILGDALLVAPVLAPSNHRLLYLPSGEWYDFEDGHRLAGGQEIYRCVPLESMPLFVKAGSILPRQWNPQHPAQAFVRDLWLDVYPGADCEAQLYEDDSHTTAYLQGEFCQTSFTLRHTEAGLRLAGAVPQGKLLGPEREVRVQMALTQPPDQVTLNGIELVAGQISYHPASRRLALDLGVLPAEQTWEVVITGRL
jgi:alpha-glucosidase (family GH31 glycosyl hydrolase)